MVWQALNTKRPEAAFAADVTAADGTVLTRSAGLRFGHRQDGAGAFFCTINGKRSRFKEKPWL